MDFFKLRKPNPIKQEYQTLDEILELLSNSNGETISSIAEKLALDYNWVNTLIDNLAEDLLIQVQSIASQTREHKRDGLVTILPKGSDFIKKGGHMDLFKHNNRLKRNDDLKFAGKVLYGILLLAFTGIAALEACHNVKRDNQVASLKSEIATLKTEIKKYEVFKEALPDSILQKYW